MSLDSSDLFTAIKNEHVVEGFCIFTVNNSVVYAGPIDDAPDAAGKVVLLNPVDWDKVKVHSARLRN